VSPIAPIPVSRYLVPADVPPPPATFTRVTQPLVNGLPQAIPLDAQLRLVVALPTGVAQPWLDADPAAVVSRSADQIAAASAAGDEANSIGAVAFAPLRVLLVRDRTPLASVPLVAGLRRTLPDAGDDGVAIELRVLGWDVRVGTVRGAGDFGSFVDLAWRRADRPGESFEPPPLSPRVAARLAEEQQQ
jgi:hypothetical protein